MRIVHARSSIGTRSASRARAIFQFRGTLLRAAFLAAVLCAAFIESNCGHAGTPPLDLSVAISPTGASLFLGASQQFQATVTGSSNTSVTWEVSGVAGGTASTGTISASGLYIAPGILPAGGSVSVTAVSLADSRGTASVTVSLMDNIVVSVLPGAVSVPGNGAQEFTASVAASGNPATGVTWAVDGIAGGNSTVGTIVSSGAGTAVYTAPSAPPSPATVTVTAVSVADLSKVGNASATVTCAATNLISPGSANVGLGAAQAFSASVCLANGASVAWSVSGVTGGNSAVGTIASTSASTAVYTAPANLPVVNPVAIQAAVTPANGAPAIAPASVTITSGVNVSVAPATAALSPSQRQSFSATVTGTLDATVTWLVNGIANGNASVGQVCMSGTNPCVAPTAPVSGGVDYLAPASAPAANPVTLTAVSHADPSRNGTAAISIANSSGTVAVTIAPQYAFVPASGSAPSTQQFSATVTGSSNGNVTWTMAAGQACTGAACGSVSATGMYSAPTATPSPNAILVTAISQADPTKSATATVALTSGPVIEVILPSSVMAGAVEGFPLVMQGVNFVAGSGSGASTILLNGVARGTTCSSSTTCTTALNPSDVQSAGTLTIQIQNPGAPAVLSNPVPFVIAPFDVSMGPISLDAAQPVAASEDIVVTEPTTAAASSPINVDFVGYLTGGNTCGVQGSPLTVTRPASGSSVVSICVHGTGLDPTFTYAFSGPSGTPNGSDIGVTASAVMGLFAGEIELDLQIANTTQPGVRALFITTLNDDRAVATGFLEVK